MSKLAVRVASLLPNAKPCDRLPLGAGDLLLQAPGFEDRTFSLLDVVEASVGCRAILLEYFPLDPRNRLQETKQRLVQIGVEVSSLIRFERFDPNDYESKLLSLLNDSGCKRVVVDISTMSKLAILLSLSAVAKSDISLTIFYGEPKIYAPSRSEFEIAKARNEIHRPSLQIYNGIHGVVRVSALASVAMQGQPTAAIAFMSFNDTLTQVLLNTVYPSRLFLVNGRPPIHHWREWATAWIHEEVRREWSDDNPLALRGDSPDRLPERAISTLDYTETVTLLLELYWQLSRGHRILLAPAGSKMQTVGCFLVKMLHEDIHVEYPSPEGFVQEYSVGLGERWLVELGNVSLLLQTLAKMERREVLHVEH